MTDDDLDRHIRAIRARENGWSDDPDDSGGPTNDGITLATWTAYLRSLGETVPSSKGARLWALKYALDSEITACYRWYFLTQGLAELIDEFSIPDELVPLLMDMRTLHSMDGCREILLLAEYTAVEGVSNSTWAIAITLSRIRYMLEVAERRPRDRKYVRGWMHRALKAIGMWPPKPETGEVREA